MLRLATLAVLNTHIFREFGPGTEEKWDLAKQNLQNASARYARRSARTYIS